MAADPNIKQIRLVSGRGGGDEDPEIVDTAATEGGGTRKKARGGRRSSAKTYKVGTITKEDGVAAGAGAGGGSTSPGTMTQLAATRVPGASPPGPEPVGVDSALTQKGASTTTGGGAAAPAPVKVVLGAPKKKKGKVVLAAAAAPKAPVAAVGGGGKTRKVARKIKVSMKSLSKKIHRAKTIRHKATEDDLETVKKALHKAGLIKADSKAPEPILRQMYADFMTLKNRAL